MAREYLFTSERLGFRNWDQVDIPLMASINADPEVMEFFPAIKTYDETIAFVEKMQLQMAVKHYCYFAVDKLEDGSFIGFIGLSEQTYESDFTPCTDIGWRLAKTEWGMGYATEGAKRCLEYALYELNLQKVVAVAPKVNVRSELVMQKTGMKKVAEFIHPLLLHYKHLKDCVLYEMITSL